MVLVTSAKERAKALIYLVTVDPQTLKDAIEKTPKMTNSMSAQLLAASLKYAPGLSM